MIKINLRNQNRIIILEATGKPPIRGRTSSSPYFHTPLELLLSALGLCVGGNIVEYCRHNDINVNIFEEIMVYLDYVNFIVNIKKPKDFSEEHQKRMKDLLTNCLVAKELAKELKIIWGDNETPTEELIKIIPTKCCGA
jgi:uncharacterized OsmC-like protein